MNVGTGLVFADKLASKQWQVTQSIPPPGSLPTVSWSANHKQSIWSPSLTTLCNAYMSMVFSGSLSGHSKWQLFGWRANFSRFTLRANIFNIGAHSRTFVEIFESKTTTASLTNLPHISARCLAFFRPPLLTRKVMSVHKDGWYKQPRHRLQTEDVFSLSAKDKYDRISTTIMLGNEAQELCAAILSSLSKIYF